MLMLVLERMRERVENVERRKVTVGGRVGGVGGVARA